VILDLDYKKHDLEEKRTEIMGIDEKINGVIPKINEVKNILNEKKKSIENIENEIRELNSLRKELSITETILNHKIEQNNRLNDEIKKLERQVEELKMHVEGKNLHEIESIIKKIGQKENETNEADAAYSGTIRKIKELEVRIEHCSETIRKIQSLEICPVCEQKVDERHKHDVSSRENKRYEELLEQIKNYKDEEFKLDKIKLELKKEIDSLMKEQNHFSILKIKLENLNEKTSQKEEKSELKEKIRREIGLLNTKKSELSQKIKIYSETEETYKIIRKEIDELLPQERFLELEKRKYETEKETTKRFIATLEKEINEKQKAREKLAYISQLSNWIDELFVNLMSTMEKHVMININSQFNELF
ncbi:MAG: hypothetical protein AABX84_02475, partial [Nanoarchaeota archaeon]